MTEAPRKSATELERLFAGSFRARTTIALADALGTLPKRAARMLRTPDRHLDWNDALLWQEAELQVTAERRDYEQDPRHAETVAHLHAVRVRLNESRILIGAYRREAAARTLPVRIASDARATARKWLTELHPREYNALLRQVLVARGVDPARPRRCRDAFDFIEQGCTDRWIDDPVTPEVQRLLQVSDGRFRQLVAQDAQDQDTPNEEFAHPLVLRRWHAALQSLAQARFRQAHARGPYDLGPAPKCLRTATPAQAEEIFAARRYLAAMNQRRLECLNLVREAVAEIEERQLDDPRRIAYAQAKKQAGLRLAAAHPAQYELIRNGLRPYESQPNVIDTSLLPNGDPRGELKKRLLAAAAATDTGEHGRR
ncbi:hypothetical protein [Nocardia sp. IFM 10818]